MTSRGSCTPATKAMELVGGAVLVTEATQARRGRVATARAALALGQGPMLAQAAGAASQLGAEALVDMAWTCDTEGARAAKARPAWILAGEELEGAVTGEGRRRSSPEPKSRTDSASCDDFSLSSRHAVDGNRRKNKSVFITSSK